MGGSEAGLPLIATEAVQHFDAMKSATFLMHEHIWICEACSLGNDATDAEIKEWCAQNKIVVERIERTRDGWFLFASRNAQSIAVNQGS